MKPFLLPAPVWDKDWAGHVLAEDATHRWILLDYNYNLRLITVPHGERHGWDYGWCYPRDQAAVRAALEDYDPDTQDEPPGWHKRPGAAVRQAPRREERPEYNRRRCCHGAYLGEECWDRFCPEMLSSQRKLKQPNAQLQEVVTWVQRKRRVEQCWFTCLTQTWWLGSRALRKHSTAKRREEQFSHWCWQ